MYIAIRLFGVVCQDGRSFEQIAPATGEVYPLARECGPRRPGARGEFFMKKERHCLFFKRWVGVPREVIEKSGNKLYF
ncbi:MAG: hypothetical protein A3A43_01790 [Candidatus Liptonbacteria bacterium RIFCSPLOWO2_01_FULL_56_20]|uniref:Uncharacterized protein n=1 Tax=Candidatus Liptonbacteria bacterium RIFCSPLOWO2_01_FULL_56_20 TaxID=1798652 RepID=A0A1G2CLA7_9BACT|nr:MAG: hypothetical protein A2681_02020 [Candidatus Liptonbacteria bacterium RIFCSPHIGHO2_01_FULL_56_18b]OGZ01208.1 MAG: hypothetical protein A3A43_01790 [Candidatus Liptonbacteria bacterium RIFCSPLOWO2_01_FULL_56_20]